jgi:hypothetical protein
VQNCIDVAIDYIASGAHERRDSFIDDSSTMSSTFDSGACRFVLFVCG